MALILIIIGLVINRSWDGIHQFRNLSWFDSFSGKVHSKIQPYISNPTGQLLAILAIPVMVVILLQDVAGENGLNLVWLLISLAILLYCLGDINIENQLDQLIDALEKNDKQASEKIVAEMTGATPSTDDASQLDDSMQATLVSLTHNLFAIILWFALLGPVGAVIYRLNYLIYRRQDNSSPLQGPAERLQGILDWIPAHLLAAGFAFTGHFEGALQAYHERTESIDMNKTNRMLMIDVANGALHGIDSTDGVEYLHAFRGLVLRSLIVWLAIIAIITLIGWN